MEAITNNWEMCIACGNTGNREGDEHCRECGFDISEDNETYKEVNNFLQ